MENFLSKKNILLFSTFFVFTPIALSIAFFVAFGMTKPTKTPISNENIYASLPNSSPELSASIVAADARSEIVRQYLAKYNSPLESYAGFMVETADKNGLDFRLLAAIAQQESNLCKFAPPETYNCWGWGIHKRGTLGFDSYQEGIETVAKGLKDNYLDKGYVTVEDIMKKYTPSSPGSWSAGVTQFMSEME